MCSASLLLVPLLLLALCGGSACSGGSEPRGRVLLVGIDGATLRVITPMLSEGRLPSLAAIAREGTHGLLRAHAPISSPRIWTSVATGKLPERHGIAGFVRDTPAGRVLYGSEDRRVPALWNIVSAAGLRVGVVNWWNTQPPERVDGVLISDHLVAMDLRDRYKLTGVTPDAQGESERIGIAWPEDWNARAAALIRDDSPLVDVPYPSEHIRRLPRWISPESYRERYEADADVVRIALAVEQEVQPDVLMVFLPGIDRVSHMHWAALEPPEAYEKPLSFTPETRHATAEALRAYYRFTDALIGRLMERFGPDDLVMVVSDHGFEAGNGIGFIRGAHFSAKAIDGVVFARGPDVVPPDRPTRPMSVNDVTPTVLAWLGLPIGGDMDGRPADFLRGAAADVEVVRSYDALRVERVGAAASGAEPEILEQLEALGYLESGDTDSEAAR